MTIRIILSAILLLILPIQAWSETLTIDDLVQRNDLFYKKFSDVPFTGEISGNWNGKFINGKRNGEWLSYHENGQLDWKGNYKDGKQDGLWEYFNGGGTLIKAETYKNDERID